MSFSGKNEKKAGFLALLDRPSLDSDNNVHTTYCKFSFAYFDVQQASQDFCDWSHEQLIHLLNDLKHFSKSPLNYWTKAKAGKGSVLSIYKSFPRTSLMTNPGHIPHQAHWARFRLSSAVRLVGFVVPGEYHDKMHATYDRRFDDNTFYVVFLDRDHSFYQSESK